MVRPIPQALYSYTSAETLTCHLIFILPSSSWLPSASVSLLCSESVRAVLTNEELELRRSRAELAARTQQSWLSGQESFLGHNPGQGPLRVQQHKGAFFCRAEFVALAAAPNASGKHLQLVRECSTAQIKCIPWRFWVRRAVKPEQTCKTTCIVPEAEILMGLWETAFSKHCAYRCKDGE